MKIEITELKIKDLIQVGDLFYAPSIKATYILHDFKGKYELLDVSGDNHWDNYENKDSAILKIRDAIDRESLIHYPHTRFKLTLSSLE